MRRRARSIDVDTSPGTIDQSKDGVVWILALRGEHDLNTAPELRDKLDDIYDSGSQVIVDLTNVGFIDSSILNVLVYGCERASQKSDHSFALVAPPDSLATRILDLVIGHRVPRFETRDVAVAATGQGQ
jgi:anti-anti-sigma factor